MPAIGRFPGGASASAIAGDPARRRTHHRLPGPVPGGLPAQFTRRGRLGTPAAPAGMAARWSTSPPSGDGRASGCSRRLAMGQLTLQLSAELRPGGDGTRARRVDDASGRHRRRTCCVDLPLVPSAPLLVRRARWTTRGPGARLVPRRRSRGNWWRRRWSLRTPRQCRRTRGRGGADPTCPGRRFSSAATQMLPVTVLPRHHRAPSSTERLRHCSNGAGRHAGAPPGSG